MALFPSSFFFQFIQRNKKIKKIAWSFERMFSPCSTCTEYSCHANFSPTAKAKQWRVKRYESLHHTYFTSVRPWQLISTCLSQPYQLQRKYLRRSTKCERRLKLNSQEGGIGKKCPKKFYERIINERISIMKPQGTLVIINTDMYLLRRSREYWQSTTFEGQSLKYFVNLLLTCIMMIGTLGPPVWS